MAKPLTPGQQALVADIVAAGLADEATATAAMGNQAASKQVAEWKRALGRKVHNIPNAAPRWRIWDAKKRGEY